MGMVQPVAKERVKGTDLFPSWAKAIQKRHARQVRQQSRKVIEEALYEIDMEEVWAQEDEKAATGRQAEAAADQAMVILAAAIAAFTKATREAYAVIDALPQAAQEELYERNLVIFPYLDY